MFAYYYFLLCSLIEITFYFHILIVIFLYVFDLTSLTQQKQYDVKMVYTMFLLGLRICSLLFVYNKT